MKIKLKPGSEKKLTFESLIKSNIFALSSSMMFDFEEDVVYMKIEEITGDDCFQYNAIRLSDGEFIYIEAETPVVLFSATLTVSEVSK